MLGARQTVQRRHRGVGTFGGRVAHATLERGEILKGVHAREDGSCSARPRRCDRVRTECHRHHHRWRGTLAARCCAARCRAARRRDRDSLCEEGAVTLAAGVSGRAAPRPAPAASAASHRQGGWRRVRMRRRADSSEHLNQSLGSRAHRMHALVDLDAARPCGLAPRLARLQPRPKFVHLVAVVDDLSGGGRIGGDGH